VSTAATGTLNLLLANRRGFVIAADSRMTQLSQPMQHWDDSQKVFKVGPKAAMAIAGLPVGHVVAPSSTKWPPHSGKNSAIVNGRQASGK